MSVNGGLSASTLSGLSGPSSGVTFGGLASGLDTNSIIQALTKAEDSATGPSWAENHL